MRVTSKPRGAARAKAHRVEERTKTSLQRLADKSFTTFMQEHNNLTRES